MIFFWPIQGEISYLTKVRGGVPGHKNPNFLKKKLLH